jgi:hypothetical protein
MTAYSKDFDLAAMVFAGRMHEEEASTFIPDLKIVRTHLKLEDGRRLLAMGVYRIQDGIGLLFWLNYSLGRARVDIGSGQFCAVGNLYGSEDHAGVSAAIHHACVELGIKVLVKYHGDSISSSPSLETVSFEEAYSREYAFAELLERENGWHKGIERIYSFKIPS